MKSRYFFNLESIKPESYAGGSVTNVTNQEMPGLENISFALLKLNAKAYQEPIWHPNANKIGYCTQGNALISMRTPNGDEVFTVAQGDIFFVPQGYIHHILNMGGKELSISFAFNHTSPQTMHLSKALYSLTESVFNSTFTTSDGFLEGLKKNKNKETIKVLEKVQPTEPVASRFKFNIGSSGKPILTHGGYVQLGTKANLPVLGGLGILGFGLNPKGIVEPHWHTNAGELVYIVKGKTRITVLAPDGNVDVLEVNGGQGAFAPASHFHNIENVGNEDVEVIAFFSNADPDYIGIGEVIGSFDNDVLASLFNVTPAYFEQFKKPTGPLVIVPI